MDGQFCGIDFGTSNSTVGLADTGGARLIALEEDAATLPSAVFWQTEGTPPLFGRAAIAAYLDGEDGRLMRGLKSTLGSGLIHDRTSVGGRAVSFREVLGRFIGHLRAAQTAAAPEIGRVVLGRPVHFVDDDPAADAAAEAVLAEIAATCGWREVAFQFEPIAAALHYETTAPCEELVLIVDIGGGTSDVSVVRVGPGRAARPDRADDILGNDGIRVGGTDFDRLLSLAEVMPHLGYLGATAGGGTMPRHYYLDLATWHRINALYTARTLADLKALRLAAAEPERIGRLMRVVEGRHGHALAMRVEEAKIALSDQGAARLNLSDLTGGPNPVIRREGFEAAVEAPLNRIAGLLGAVLAQAGVAVNLQEWPMFVLLEGTVLNFLVVGANGGFMPVSELCLKNADFPMSRIVDGVIDLNHVIETGSTRLVFLADIIPLNNPYPFPRILSIGDIIMCAGFFLYIVKKVTNDFRRAGRTAKSAKRRECID